jgi:rare lipoprotein A
MKKLAFIIAALAMGAGVAFAQTPVAPSAQPSAVTLAARAQSSIVTKKRAAETQDASYGLASYYGHESPTASGEKFIARELTAAHRTLPFGTRVRVTNVATGQSVTVRVNDRGPFVPGRIVDVSHSAAETLGIIGRGVAKVKLDVVQ